MRKPYGCAPGKPLQLRIMTPLPRRRVAATKKVRGRGSPRCWVFVCSARAWEPALLGVCVHGAGAGARAAAWLCAWRGRGSPRCWVFVCSARAWEPALPHGCVLGAGVGARAAGCLCAWRGRGSPRYWVFVCLARAWEPFDHAHGPELDGVREPRRTVEGPALLAFLLPAAAPTPPHLKWRAKKVRGKRTSCWEKD